MQAGRASTIELLDGDRILRRGGDPQREAEIMAVAREHGFPVPAVHEVRPDSLVMDRVAGPTMGEDLAHRPWLARRQMRVLADLHRRLHAIQLEGGVLVHYDLHPLNVMLSPSGPVVIDWTNARAGAADADVALTWLILATCAGWRGRLLARFFAGAAGTNAIVRGLPAARDFRLADWNVTDAERRRAQRATL
jgi:aminoglycoside phosphotransferase (APT) family kinase protein